MILFKDLLDSDKGKVFLDKLCVPYKDRKTKLFKRWYRETGERGETYPSQGLLKTPYDYLDNVGNTIMGEEELWLTLRMRRYVLEIFNHPERLAELGKVQRKKFIAPPKINSKVMEYGVRQGLAYSIRDLGAAVVGTDGQRVARRELLKRGPFVKLGKQARIPFASGAMPDIFGAPAALATMAMCHGIACVPRNGLFSQLKRQVDLVRATFDWMKGEKLLDGRKDRRKLISIWKRNVIGVVEPEVRSGMKRVEALYKAGVRGFRIYSPEPGLDALKMVSAIRKEYGVRVDIFVGQVASVSQAKDLEEAGADGLYLGIGGGGRCITAVRSGTVVDWPILLWKLRGEVGLPIIIEGGASDHVGVTLLLGASGVGVSRSAAGGTIESPGGLLYWVNKKGQWFKPYGGEASARTKYLDGKILAMGLPAFVEGETDRAIKSYIPHAKPTVAENIYFLLEDVILSLVFRGASSIVDLQSIDPSPLRRLSEGGVAQQNTH